MQYSVVNYKTVLADNELFRIDADFFRTDYLNSENKIKLHKWDYLGNLSKQIINFGAYSLTNQINYLDQGVPFLNVGDIKDNWIDIENVKRIDEKLSQNVLKKSLCKENQVLLTIAGTIGNAAVAYGLPCHTNSNQAIANISLSDLSPFYLSIFLNSFYGKQQTARLTISSVQPNLLLTQVKKIKVFIPRKDFQEIIEKIYKKAYQNKNNGKALYAETERLLLDELGVLNWNPGVVLSYVKNFSETQKAERFDAEYFQPKYEEIVAAVKKYPGGFDELGNLVKVKKSVEPGSEAYRESGITFVRVSNISKFELSDNNQQFISETLYEELKKHQPRVDEILLSKDATPGIAYHLNETPQKMIVSGGILRLKVASPRILPEYLTLVLNSAIVQKQIERDSGGSIINHWRLDQVKATLIPLLGDEKQNEIKQLVAESFKCRKLSKALLEIAKRGVEIAIETDEVAAQTWITAELEKLKIKL
jgi:restriction endonuclease S subunit